MAHNAPTVHDLAWLLLQMGFVPVPTTGSHKAFQHQETGTIVVLPSDDADDRMRAAHLIAIRKTVVDRGIVDDEAFDHLLRKSAGTAQASTLSVS